MLAASVAALTALARRTLRIRIEGPSMEPTFADGDRLLVWRTDRLSPGQVAVVRDPREPTRLWVKRVHDVADDGLDVRGDDPDRSTDSRTVGLIPRRLVVGRVVRRYAVAGTTTPITPPR